jgi:putative ABC transport system permease protein
VLRLWRRGRVTAEVDDEFAFHLDMRTRELIATGLTPEEARGAALRQFGDVNDATTYCRRTGERRERRIMRTEWFLGLGQDLRFALRTLRRSPAFTVVAALTLALGIGANTAIFSVVRGILLRPLPFRDPSQLVMVPATYQGKRIPVSPANAYDWRSQNRSFSGMAMATNHSAVITGNGDPERLRGFDVGPDLFGILGVNALRGRSMFSADEARWQGPKAVLIGESLWRTRFGSNPSLVGSMITLDNERYQVIGVVPAASTWPTGALIWFPFSYDPATLEQSRGAVYLNMIARLKPGVTRAAAEADMRAITARLATQYPDANTGVGAGVVPLQEWMTGNLRTPLLVLLGGVGFVLLIACANVANLLLVRGVTREPELAVRTALGAGRGRLLRQLVTESVVLALVGGVLAIGLALVGTRMLVHAAPAGTPRLDSIRVDGVVLGLTLITATVIGVLFGLLPSRRILRPDLARTLREAGRGGGKAGRHAARRLLVVAEVALSVMLLAGAGLLIRSFNRLMNVDPGFRTENSTSFALSLPDAKYPSPELKNAFMDQLTERLKVLPGVQSVGAAMGMPLTPFGFFFSFEIAGRPPLKPADQPAAEVRVATPTYLSTMGIPVLSGRGIVATDRPGAPGALLITQAAAKQFFPHENPIGKHVTLGWGPPGHAVEGDIVGVVGDVKQLSLATATNPQFWIPYAQRPVESFNVVLHGTRDPGLLVGEARRAVHDLDPDLAVSQIRTLDQVVAESVAQPRFYMTLLAAFAVVALVLSAIGIYGVIAYLVGQRSREIGIRIALGAEPGRVIAMIVREGAAMIATGLVIGLAGALALTRLMGALLFDTSTTDPLTYAAVIATLAGVALLASGVPALRAAQVDPALTMRAE